MTNCGATPRTIGVEARPATTGGGPSSPPALALGPLERGVIVASLAIPAKAGTGEEREALIWVHGCRDHVLRWTVKVASRGGDCLPRGRRRGLPRPPSTTGTTTSICERPCVHGAD